MISCIRWKRRVSKGIVGAREKVLRSFVSRVRIWWEDGVMGNCDVVFEGAGLKRDVGENL